MKIPVIVFLANILLCSYSLVAVADNNQYDDIGEGILVVKGALVTSPCTLSTNEVELPEYNPRLFSKNDYRYPLELKLVGCGDGSEFITPIAATIESRMVTKSQLISVLGRDTGVGPVEANLIGGDNVITYYLSRYQRRVNESSLNATLALKLSYQ